MFTILIFLTGIISGLFLVALTLWLIKVKCPACKQPKPLHQIILWHWKARTITGQPCQRCQRPQPQKDQIEL